MIQVTHAGCKTLRIVRDNREKERSQPTPPTPSSEDSTSLQWKMSFSASTTDFSQRDDDQPAGLHAHGGTIIGLYHVDALTPFLTLHDIGEKRMTLRERLRVFLERCEISR